VENLDFFCIQGLGLAIVAGSSLVKFPQVKITKFKFFGGIYVLKKPPPP